jgi:hypothetical protein
MSSPDLAYQTVIYAAIRDEFPSGNVGTFVPNDTALPYIHIAHSQDDVNADDVQRLEIVVDTWSSLDGPHEVKAFQDRIALAVAAADLSQSGWAFSIPLVEFANCLFDSEANCWHGSQRITTFATAE